MHGYWSWECKFLVQDLEGGGLEGPGACAHYLVACLIFYFIITYSIFDHPGIHNFHIAPKLSKLKNNLIALKKPLPSLLLLFISSIRCLYSINIISLNFIPIPPFTLEHPIEHAHPHRSAPQPQYAVASNPVHPPHILDAQESHPVITQVNVRVHALDVPFHVRDFSLRGRQMGAQGLGCLAVRAAVVAQPELVGASVQQNQRPGGFVEAGKLFEL